MTKRKTCFVISPIGSTDSQQRKRADTVLKHVFRPALEPLGYDVIRADEISTPGSITLQVLEKVLESEIVIADLTDHNPNVFYELAVRHGSQLPVIHVIASDQKIPFDIADLRTIPIDIDLDGAERSRQAIVAQAKEIQSGHVGVTPIKVAAALRHLSSGTSDEQLIMKQILEALTEMRSELRRSFAQSQPAVEGFTLHEPPVSDTSELLDYKTRRPLHYSFLKERVQAFLKQNGDDLLEFTIRPQGAEILYDVVTREGRRASVQMKSKNIERVLDSLFHLLNAPPDGE